MQTLQHKHIGLWLLAISLVWPAATFACNVPLFRYALERWEPDAYVFVVFHSQPLTAEQQTMRARTYRNHKEAWKRLIEV